MDGQEMYIYLMNRFRSHMIKFLIYIQVVCLTLNILISNSLYIDIIICIMYNNISPFFSKCDPFYAKNFWVLADYSFMDFPTLGL